MLFFSDFRLSSTGTGLYTLAALVVDVLPDAAHISHGIPKFSPTKEWEHGTLELIQFLYLSSIPRYIILCQTTGDTRNWDCDQKIVVWVRAVPRPLPFGKGIQDAKSILQSATKSMGTQNRFGIPAPAEFPWAGTGKSHHPTLPAILASMGLAQHTPTAGPYKC